MKTIIFILGPTSSGKSLLAIKLAKHINGEIISSDSMQIYKYMNVLSGKINFKEQEGIIHHMLDIIEPYEEFSVFQYFEITKKIVSNIFSKNKIPIITGGTGLYSKVLMNNNIMSRNPEIYKRINNIYKIYGKKFLFKWINNLNYNQSTKIFHCNDVKRIIRSLEIFYDNINNININNVIKQNELCNENIRFVKFVLMPINRNDLYKKIDTRVDLMIKQNLLNEVQKLYNEFNLSKTAQQAIGYKELLPYFQDKSKLESCITNIKTKSRNYAKRQITWFKKQEASNFIYYNINDSINCLLKKIMLVINNEVT